MAISELVMEIKCNKRPWFRPALCACYVLVKARVISYESAERFLIDRCMKFRIEDPVTGRRC